MAERPATTITGDDIISELIHNIDVGLFKVGRTVLVPCRFNVYLHQQDFDLIHPVEQVVRREARRALNEHLERLNKGQPQPVLMKKLGLANSAGNPEYKILEKDWSVEFHRGEEDRFRPGEMEIYSDLGTEQTADLGIGAKTTFVTRHSAEDASASIPRNISAADSGTVSNSSAAALATLRYADNRGEKLFAMTRDEIVIGRGGKAVWVDLKLDGPPDISREHCRIRRDPKTGGFFVKDLSQYGTAVNGRAIPSSIERAAQGDRVDRNIEVALPRAAKITLADVLVIDFEAKPPE